MPRAKATASAEATFASAFAALVLQDASGVWAAFEGGRFSTSDPAIIDRLRAAEGVTEVTKKSEE